MARLTIVKGWNSEDIDDYADLIALAMAYLEKAPSEADSVAYQARFTPICIHTHPPAAGPRGGQKAPQSRSAA